MTQNGISMRDLTAIGIGMAAGVVASRLLPPLVAQAVGGMRARSGADPFDRLIQDHRRILSVLDRMLDVPEDRRAERAKLFLSLKRTLAKHALAEEDIVYPALHDDVHDVEQTKHLYDEHADMKIHLFELERMLMNNENWNRRVESLRDLVQRHVRDEEEIEFPKLRQYLDDQRKRTLSQNIQREEALVL
jgi:iron-sulfur cluster repair protein YtfE (RIC family)